MRACRAFSYFHLPTGHILHKKWVMSSEKIQINIAALFLGSFLEDHVQNLRGKVMEKK